MIVFNKKGEVSFLIVGIIIILLVFLVLILFFPREILERLNIIGVLGGAIENREAIRTDCILACNDGDLDFYCNKVQNLRLGDNHRIRASCFELSRMNINSFRGLSSCNNKAVFCDIEKSIPPKCYYKSGLIDCEELLE